LLKALAFFLESVEVFSAEFTLKQSMLFQGVEDAVVVVHELVVQVWSERAS
jgi:hypothetical protein